MPSTLFNDTFVRADAASWGNGWTPYSGVLGHITSNKGYLKSNGVANNGSARLMRPDSETARNVEVTVHRDLGDNDQICFVFLRAQGALGRAYMFTYWSSQFVIDVEETPGDVAPTRVGYKPMFGGADPAPLPLIPLVFKFRAQDNPGGGTDVSVTVTKQSDGTAVGSFTVAGDTAGPQLTGTTGVSAKTAIDAQYTRYTVENLDGGGALTAPTIAVSGDADGLILTATATEGGTPPLTAVWKYHVDPSTLAAGGGTALSGGTIGGIGPFVPVDDTAYCYCLSVTDSAASPATVRSVPVASTRRLGPLVVSCLGDSITYGDGGADGLDRYVAEELTLLIGDRTATCLNEGQNSWTAGTWLESTYLAGAIGRNLAVSPGATGATRLFSVMLGTNDVRTGRTVAAFKADMASICAQIITGGCVPVLHQIPYGNRYALETVPAFNAAIDELCDGTTIFKGDRLMYRFLANNWPELYINGDTIDPDNVHPGGDGRLALGKAHARGIVNYLGGLTGAGGGASFPVFGSSLIQGDV